MPRALIVEILGNAKQFGAELDRAAGKTRSMSKVAGVAGLAIAGGLAVGLDKSVKAAEEGQQATARLELAFKNSGESAKKYAGQIEETESAGRKLGFTDVETRNSLASLELATHSHTVALKSMGAAEDLARFKHISLEQATKALTMAQTGSQRALKQLGLTVQPVTTAQDKLKIALRNQITTIREHYASMGKLSNAQKANEQAAIDNATASEKTRLAYAKVTDTQVTAGKITDLLSQKLHGQADAYSKTAQGGVAVMHANVESLEENLGNALLPAITNVSGKLAALTGFFAEHAGVTKVLVGVLGGLAATLLAVSAYQKLAAAATTIWSGVTKAATAAQWLLNAALDANPIGIVVIALAALGAALVIAWEKSKTFREIVLNVWDDVKAGVMRVVNFFTNTVPQAFNDVKDGVVGAFKDVLSWVRGHWPEIVTLISGPFAPIVGLATNAFGVRDALIGAFDDVRDGAKRIWDKIVGVVRSAAGSFSDAVQPIINAIDSIIGVLKDLFSWASKALGVLGDVLGSGHGKGPPGGPRGGGPKRVPHLAAGGIVNGPTLAMIGESGPEAVVPLPDAAGFGGGLELHVHFDGNVFGDKRAVAREIVDDIRDELVRIGMREPTIFSRKGVKP